MTAVKRVEFRGRLVANDYPKRHAQAQLITAYDDFTDGTRRNRLPYGDPKDRYPGGIIYETRQERIAYRIKSRQDALASLDPDDTEGRARVDQIYPHKDDQNDLVPPDEVIRTDHRCPDCDVDVGEFHLPGCDIEVCPRCAGQAISCGCDKKIHPDLAMTLDDIKTPWLRAAVAIHATYYVLGFPPEHVYLMVRRGPTNSLHAFSVLTRGGRPADETREREFWFDCGPIGNATDAQIRSLWEGGVQAYNDADLAARHAFTSQWRPDSVALFLALMDKGFWPPPGGFVTDPEPEP